MTFNLVATFNLADGAIIKRCSFSVRWCFAVGMVAEEVAVVVDVTFFKADCFSGGVVEVEFMSLLAVEVSNKRDGYVVMLPIIVWL